MSGSIAWLGSNCAMYRLSRKPFAHIPRTTITLAGARTPRLENAYLRQHRFWGCIARSAEFFRVILGIPQKNRAIDNSGCTGPVYSHKGGGGRECWSCPRLAQITQESISTQRRTTTGHEEHAHQLSQEKKRDLGPNSTARHKGLAEHPFFLR